MILNISIKLTSAFIGSRSVDPESGMRRITRVNEKNPKLFTRRIRELFYKYVTEELKKDYNYRAIKMTGSLTVDPEAKIGVHSRKFKDKFTGEERVEKFEAYPAGTNMTFDICVDDHYLNREETVKVVTLIGKYDGISQFGTDWGYGRFTVEKVEDNHDLTEEMVSATIMEHTSSALANSASASGNLNSFNEWHVTSDKKADDTIKPGDSVALDTATAEKEAAVAQQE